MIGRRVRCTQCREAVVVPQPAAEETPPAREGPAKAPAASFDEEETLVSAPKFKAIEAEMDMTPMCDVTFQLLIFFMVTARPTPREADLGVHLPGTAAQEGPVTFPDEQRIVIGAAGEIVLNDQVLESGATRSLTTLAGVLARFREASEANGTGALVVLDVADDAAHQRVIDVLDACARAGLRGVTFAAGDGEEDRGKWHLRG